LPRTVRIWKRCPALFSDFAHCCADRGRLVTSNGTAWRTGPSIVNAAFTQVTAQALDALEALAGLDAEVVLPGHGEPFTGGVSEAVRLARLAGAA
jgi:glyoxylase-like metal-dependent hydrolase (beta-lactamase superfamily II)